MLNTTKTTTINGTSTTEDNKIIATMHYSLSENGSVAVNSNITNKDLYEANKEMVRADIDAFTELCRKEEDEEVTA